MDSSVLILPPWSPGSLGDEAILTAAAVELRARGVKEIGVIPYKPDDNWKHLGPVTQTLSMEGYFDHGSWRDRFYFARLVSRYEHFYVFGTDLLDGFYSEENAVRRIALAALAARTGAQTTLASFSYNRRPAPASIAALRGLPSGVRLRSRDPVSCDRLTQHLERPVELVADVAFLLDPAKDSETVSLVSRWTCLQRNAGRTVIGINVNHLVLKQIAGLEPEELVQVFASAMAELFLRCDPLSFLLIPHDTRGKVSDVSLAKALLETVPPEIKPYCLQVPTPCRAVEIKAICAEIDIVLSGKMHLAIACLGQGTPVACITYQDKFEGLFKHFELDGLTIAPEQALQPGNLAKFLMPLVERREDIRRHIQSRLPQIQRLAQANFKQIMG
jgi:polysaccharide pyruvyl transferase WcaK-like protein